jgi:hypothetical protein
MDYQINPSKISIFCDNLFKIWILAYVNLSNEVFIFKFFGEMCLDSIEHLVNDI